jgi:anti-sigma factor RsiW
MSCAEIRKLLHACADGELDLLRSMEVEQHLKACPRCAAERTSLQSLRAALRENDLAWRAPDSLRNEIGKMSRPAAEENRRGQNPWIWKWLAAGATAFAALTILLRPAGVSSRGELLDEVVASHVRSLQAEHLTDVASSDQHTVKPWFDGKIDFAPAVTDFAAQNFPLVGGRLDYLNSRAVAALVYRHNKHLINVFIWPETSATPAATEKDRGYSVINCSANGFHYCLVSDLNAKELHDLAALLAP